MFWVPWVNEYHSHAPYHSFRVSSLPASPTARSMSLLLFLQLSPPSTSGPQTINSPPLLFASPLSPSFLSFRVFSRHLLSPSCILSLHLWISPHDLWVPRLSLIRASPHILYASPFVSTTRFLPLPPRVYGRLTFSFYYPSHRLSPLASFYGHLVECKPLWSWS